MDSANGSRAMDDGPSAPPMKVAAGGGDGGGGRSSSSSSGLPYRIAALAIAASILTLTLMVFRVEQPAALQQRLAPAVVRPAAEDLIQPNSSSSLVDVNPNTTSMSGPPPPLTQQRKCVVLVSLHSASRDRDLPEWNNLAHFLSHGYIPANTPTSMYSSVEYLFLIHIDGVHPRIREGLHGKKSTGGGRGGGGGKAQRARRSGVLGDRSEYHDVPGAPNVQIVVTPHAMADLNMVQYVFPALRRDPTIVRYITLNTGTRGPLLPPEAMLGTGAVKGAKRGASPYYWVDVAGGGRLAEHMARVGYKGERAHFAKDSVAKSANASRSGAVGGSRRGNADPYGGLVVGSLFSKAMRQHMQSYFLSLPPQAADLYYGTFMNYANKDRFIQDVEVVFPGRLHGEGFALYAMGQGYSFEAAERLLQGGSDPNFVSDCPMCCLFTKYGGDIWRAGQYHTLAFVEGAESITTAMRAKLQQSIDTSSMASLGRRAAVAQIERALQEHWCATASASIYLPPDDVLESLRGQQQQNN